MPVTQTMTFSATVPQTGESPSTFNANAISCWTDLKDNIVPNLNIAFGQMNTLETNVNAKEASATTAATTATTKAQLATDYAEKTGLEVEAGTYSAKEFAIGDLTVTGGSAKAWAIDTTSPDGTSNKSAKSYAIDAQASAEASENSRLAAETILDNFDDRYLGAKAVEPTLDNDGNPLQSGALYYNTTSDTMYVYDSELTTWIDISFIPTDHGGLTGLSDDDHTQYHNDTRGDIRYYTKAQAQEKLESGINIKTVGGQSLIGGGNIDVTSNLTRTVTLMNMAEKQDPIYVVGSTTKQLYAVKQPQSSGVYLESSNSGNLSAVYVPSVDKTIVFYFATDLKYSLASYNSTTKAVTATAGAVLDNTNTGELIYMAKYHSQSGYVLAITHGDSSGTFYLLSTDGTTVTKTQKTTFTSSYAQTTGGFIITNSGAVVTIFLDSSYYVKSTVGTVSGSTISFGTSQSVSSQVAANYRKPFIVYDSVNDKVIYAYTRDTGSSYTIEAVVGTVSGSTISFGTPLVLATDSSTYGNYKDYHMIKAMHYDEVAGAIYIAAELQADSNTSGTMYYKTLYVDGTSLVDFGGTSARTLFPINASSFESRFFPPVKIGDITYSINMSSSGFNYGQQLNLSIVNINSDKSISYVTPEHTLTDATLGSAVSSFDGYYLTYTGDANYCLLFSRNANGYVLCKVVDLISEHWSQTGKTTFGISNGVGTTIEMALPRGFITGLTGLTVGNSISSRGYAYGKAITSTDVQLT